MVALGSHLRFYLYREATDMRKSFDGLCGLVSSELECDPLSGDVYVFINRRRDRIKLLIWDRNGFWLFYHRLEKGRFQFPQEMADSPAVAICYEELIMLLEGIDLTSLKRRRRYRRDPLAADG
jgi:transposase